MLRRRILPLVLMASGALAMASPLILHRFDRWRQAELLAHAPRPTVSLVKTARFLQKTALAAPTTSEPPVGQVIGRLSIPALGIVSAVIQGTNDAQLLQAPGHYPLSVLPGQAGLSVIAAHNATYFRQINHLKPGDHITVTTAQGIFTFSVASHQIVGANQGLPDSSAPTLALEACYPLDALYFTPDRYIVYAALTRSVLTSERVVPPDTPGVRQQYQAQMDPAIAHAYPLLLSQNNLPMGTLRYRTPERGHAFLSFLAGPGPLNLTEQAVRLLEAYRYTSQHGQLSWLRSIIPNANPGTDPFWDRRQVVFEARIQSVATLDAAGAPVGFRIEAQDVRINGLPYTVQFTYRVRQGVLSLTAVTVLKSS